MRTTSCGRNGRGAASWRAGRPGTTTAARRSHRNCSVLTSHGSDSAKVLAEGKEGERGGNGGGERRGKEERWERGKEGVGGKGQGAEGREGDLGPKRVRGYRARDTKEGLKGSGNPEICANR